MRDYVGKYMAYSINVGIMKVFTTKTGFELAISWFEGGAAIFMAHS